MIYGLNAYKIHLNIHERTRFTQANYLYWEGANVIKNCSKPYYRYLIIIAVAQIWYIIHKHTVNYIFFLQWLRTISKFKYSPFLKWKKSYFLNIFCSIYRPIIYYNQMIMKKVLVKCSFKQFSIIGQYKKKMFLLQ